MMIDLGPKRKRKLPESQVIQNEEAKCMIWYATMPCRTQVYSEHTGTELDWAWSSSLSVAAMSAP